MTQRLSNTFSNFLSRLSNRGNRSRTEGIATNTRGNNTENNGRTYNKRQLKKLSKKCTESGIIDAKASKKLKDLPINCIQDLIRAIDVLLTQEKIFITELKSLATLHQNILETANFGPLKYNAIYLQSFKVNFQAITLINLNITMQFQSLSVCCELFKKKQTIGYLGPIIQHFENYEHLMNQKNCMKKLRIEIPVMKRLLEFLNSTNPTNPDIKTFSVKIGVVLARCTEMAMFKSNIEQYKQHAQLDQIDYKDTLIVSNLWTEFFEEETYYTMKRNIPNGQYRGIALIINIDQYDHSKNDSRLGKSIPVNGGESKLEGSYKDVAELKKTFGQVLKYKCQVYQDITQTNFDELIDDFAEKDFTQYDSFVCIIMSHGNEKGEIASSDCHAILLGDVFTIIGGNRTLLKKPKLFFIDSCRGTDGLHLSMDDKRKIKKNNPGRVDLFRSYAPFRSNLNETEFDQVADTLEIYGTTSGYRSFTYSDGSEFIQMLCEVFNRHATKCTLSTIIKKVRKQQQVKAAICEPNVDRSKNQCSKDEGTLLKEVFYGEVLESVGVIALMK